MMARDMQDHSGLSDKSVRNSLQDADVQVTNLSSQDSGPELVSSV